VAGPRFLFIYKDIDVVDRADGPVRWRLLGANNRELGRGPGPFPELETCQAAVRELVARIAAATPCIVGDSDRTGAWSWRLDLNGRAVAVSWRTYLRHRECAYSLAHFIDAVPHAVVAPAPCAGGRR
jgi:hypothetical protein